MFLRRNFFSITLIVLFSLALTASFYRFYVQQDYLVKNEIECDPYTQECFVWCEEELCEDPYYYAYAIRQASDVREACGYDINECDEAWYCDPEEIACEVQFCDPTFGDCETLNLADEPDERLTEEAL